MPPPLSSTSTGTHLTTSRIHRILRPLKTKCAGLASTVAGGKPTGGGRITCSSRNRVSKTNLSSSSSTNTDEPPPLAVLPPPEQMQHSRSTSQYDSIGNQVVLSRNIYGIRDAFRNIINIAFGGGWYDPYSRGSTSSGMSGENPGSSSIGHVVSLAGLCAMVIGKELGAGQEGDKMEEGEISDDEECGKEEEETTRWVDEIYEEIPFHIRRWTVVSHALQIIFQSCPPHPTLLYLLLEVFVTHLRSSNMVPLAEMVLRALMTVSFTSPSTPTAITPLPPPICHDAHPAFLTSLLSLWCHSSFGDSETFLSILLDVSVYGTSEAWTSKAVSTLAKELSKANFSTLVRMATRLVDIIAQSKDRTSKVDKRPAGRRISLLLRWLQQIFDRLIYTDFVEGDTELCLRCLELVSTYFENDLGTRLVTKSGKQAKEVDSVAVNITIWFLAVFPPAFSPVEDARRLIRYLQSSDARPAIFTPLVSRFFGSVSDDEVPWDMLDQLHSFASALSSNELYELELSMVRQIQEEFQNVFGVTLGYEPEYERIMRDLQESIKSAEAAIAAAGPLDVRVSSSRLKSPSITPLIHRNRYLPLPQSSLRSSTRSHQRDSSPTPHLQRPQSQSPPPSSSSSSKSKPGTATPPTPDEQRCILPPPTFSGTPPLPPPSHPPLKKRKRATVYIELTPWVVKKRRMLAQGQSHTATGFSALPGNNPNSLSPYTRKHNTRTRISGYSPDRLIRVVNKERDSSADTASSCSPTSSTARLIASRRCGRAPSPSPTPHGDEDDSVPETSEESGSDLEAEGRESDSGEEAGDDPFVMQTSDDPLNLFALPDSSPKARPVRNKKTRPLPRSRRALSS